MKYFVLGGTGMMGRVAVWDLIRNTNGEVIVGGTDSQKLVQMEREYSESRLSSEKIDVTDALSTTRVLRDIDVAVNCVSYRYNLRIMEACIRTGIHYVDLGGLFHFTKKQLKLDGKFRKIGKTAILGMGSTPGITNVMAAYGSRDFEKIQTIDVSAGGRDLSRMKGTGIPYSINTLIDEFSMKPALLRNGKMGFVKPLSGKRRIEFPEPVGRRETFYTLHSELATFPDSFRGFGLRNCSFRVAFEKSFVKKILRFGKNILPEGNKKQGKKNDAECLRVELTGKGSAGENLKVTVDCIARSVGKFGAGDVDTGTPISIVAQMIARGEIKEEGVFPPEFHIPEQGFFKELEKRGMKIRKKKSR